MYSKESEGGNFSSLEHYFLICELANPQIDLNNIFLIVLTGYRVTIKTNLEIRPLNNYSMN